MSRKQELYQDILTWCLPALRNSLSNLHHGYWWQMSPLKRKRIAHSGYEIAQFIHALHATILQEEFSEHDFWFLNHHARAFIERNQVKSLHLYGMMAYFIQELIKAVPEEMRHKLEWSGPPEDYSWARPRSGDEL